MMELALPWLQLCVVVPIVGGIIIARVRNHEIARNWTAIATLITLATAIGAWIDFNRFDEFEVTDRWEIGYLFTGTHWFGLDEFSAPLMPVAALLYLLTIASTLRTKIKRFSFAYALFAEAILMATLASKTHWMIVFMLCLGAVLPFLELRRRKRPTRVYVIHMGTFVVLLLLGWTIVSFVGVDNPQSLWGIIPVMAAVLIRCGIAPVHCWITDLFENATFGTALLFVTPMVGEYAAVRLVLPIAPEWALRSIAILSLITTVYAAGMSLVQKESRRFFCYMFLSHTSLVLVGLESVTPIGLAGGLSVWLSGSLALTGLGLTLRSLESRSGRLSLTEYHGLYDRTPTLAALFLLTGLASVGFPGTFGFVGTELLIDSAVQVYPYVGIAVVLALTLNGIAILKAYFLIFTGRKNSTAISLRSGLVERIAVLSLAFLILGGGILPQPGISSRYHAAVELFRHYHLKFPINLPNSTSSDPSSQHDAAIHGENSDDDEADWPRVELHADESTEDEKPQKEE